MDNDNPLCLIAQDDAYENLALAAVCRRAPAMHLLDRISPRRACAPSFLLRVVNATANEPLPDVLEWVLQRNEIMLTVIAITEAKLQVLDWLLTRKPDIFSWEHHAFWAWLEPRTAAFAAIYSWFAARVDVQDLALQAIKNDIKNPSHYLSYDSASFLLSLGPHPALEMAMLRAIIERRFWLCLPLFASKPRLVRELCMENGGLLLHCLESRKGKRRNRLAGPRKFVQQFLSPSDYASAGLAVPRPH